MNYIAAATLTNEKWLSYANFVTGLASIYAMKDFNTKITMGTLGLVGEFGEVTEVFSENKDKNALILECGDMYWYLVFLMHNVFSVNQYNLGGWADIYSKITKRESIIYNLTIHIGRFVDITKKLLFHGQKYTEDIRNDLLLHFAFVYADYMYFVTNILQSTLITVVDCNVEKLSARYSEKKFNVNEFLAKEAAKRA